MPRHPGVLKGWWWDFWFHQPHVEQRAPTFSYTPQRFHGFTNYLHVPRGQRGCCQAEARIEPQKGQSRAKINSFKSVFSLINSTKNIFFPHHRGLSRASCSGDHGVRGSQPSHPVWHQQTPSPPPCTSAQSSFVCLFLFLSSIWPLSLPDARPGSLCSARTLFPHSPLGRGSEPPCCPTMGYRDAPSCTLVQRRWGQWRGPHLAGPGSHPHTGDRSCHEQWVLLPKALCSQDGSGGPAALHRLLSLPRAGLRHSGLTREDLPPAPTISHVRRALRRGGPWDASLLPSPKPAAASKPQPVGCPWHRATRVHIPCKGDMSWLPSVPFLLRAALGGLAQRCCPKTPSPRRASMRGERPGWQRWARAAPAHCSVGAAGGAFWP